MRIDQRGIAVRLCEAGNRCANDAEYYIHNMTSYQSQMLMPRLFCGPCKEKLMAQNGPPGKGAPADPPVVAGEIAKGEW